LPIAFMASSANVWQRFRSIALCRCRFTISIIADDSSCLLNVALLGMCFVGFDDHLDQFVTNDVLLREVDKLDALEI